jgi:serine/threonine protein kinase
MPALRPGDPTKLGDWTLTRRIAEGGAGNVFQGVRGVDDSENAAIKVLKDDAFDVVATQEYLKREITALKLIDHENVAKFIEANFTSGEMWLATEYVYGPNLETYLKQNPSGIAEHRWFQIAENILSGLVAIHSHNIIHRDISPKNVMLSEQTRAAKIIDFGISFVPTFTEFSERTSFEGSRLFAAPENITLKDDPKMDVFSAGVTLAYLGRGSFIWQGDTKGEISNSIMKGLPNLEGLTENQQEFLKPLLAKLPSERSSSKEAHDKALEYLEYLVDAENRKKPKPLIIKKSFSRKVDNHILKYGAAVIIVMGAAAVTFGLSTDKNSMVSVPTQDLITPEATIPNSSPIAEIAPATKLNDSFTLNTDSSPRNPNELKCNNALNAKLYDEAIALCLKAVEQQDARGALLLGTVYGYKNDDVNSEKYFKLAASMGYPRAYGALGIYYEISKKDLKTAETWYKKGVATKDPQNYVLYALSLITAKRFSEAEKYLILADKAGLTWGTQQLGSLYVKMGNKDLAAKYLLSAASSGDAEGMYQYAELLRTSFDNLDKACLWYTSVSKNTNSDSANFPSLAKTALLNYCQSGLTGTPILSDNVVSGEENSQPFNSEELIWVLPAENLKADFNYVQFKVVGSSDGWKGISFAEFKKSDGKPFLQVNFNSAAKDKCIDFRLIKVEQSKVTKIWNLNPSNCYSWNNGNATKIVR